MYNIFKYKKNIINNKYIYILSFNEILDLFYLLKNKKEFYLKIFIYIINFKINIKYIINIIFIIIIFKIYFKKNIKKKKYINNITNIVGTGGDYLNTLNISTACTFIVASCGGNIIKHGGKMISSRSGSIDLLKILNIKINNNINLIKLKKTGILFFLLSNLNIIIKNITFYRKKIIKKNILNIILPFINIIKTKTIVIGSFNKKIGKIQISIAKYLNYKKALIICGENNLDECSIDGYTKIFEYNNNKIIDYYINIRDFNLKINNIKLLKINNIIDSKNKIIYVFKGNKNYNYKILSLNAGITLYILNLVNSIKQGILLCNKIISSGLVLNKILNKINENFK